MDRRGIFRAGFLSIFQICRTTGSKVMGENVPSGVPKYAIFYHFNSRRELHCIFLLEQEDIKLIGTYAHYIWLKAEFIIENSYAVCFLVPIRVKML